MNVILLVLAIVCFCLQAFGAHLGSHPDLLGWIGLAFFAAAFLVGPLLARANA